MLEIGSGTGEHAICFAKALPGLAWLPSDPDAASRASIEAWIAAERLANVRAPGAIDVCQAVWGVEDDAPFGAMISLNMVHIAPWQAALGLLAGAGRLLRPDGILYFYGPFMSGFLRPLHVGWDTLSRVQRRLRRRPQEARPALGHPRRRRPRR